MNNFADITLLESCIIKRDILTIIHYQPQRRRGGEGQRCCRWRRLGYQSPLPLMPRPRHQPWLPHHLRNQPRTPWPFWILQRRETCACAWWLPFLSEISRCRQLHPPPVSWDFVLAAILLCPRMLRDFLLRQCFCLLHDFIMRLGASKKREKSFGARANFSLGK